MWVPLVENYEYDGPGADYFVKKSLDHLMSRDPQIDCLILGCTHYPLLMDKIKKYIPSGVRIMPQGDYVASSLKCYLERHPEMQERLSQGGKILYHTTEQADVFQLSASVFMGQKVTAERVLLQ